MFVVIQSGQQKKQMKSATSSFVLSKRLSWLNRTLIYTCNAQSFYWLPTSRKIYY
jgi:hypothetical protein